MGKVRVQPTGGGSTSSEVGLGAAGCNRSLVVSASPTGAPKRAGSGHGGAGCVGTGCDVQRPPKTTTKSTAHNAALSIRHMQRVDGSTTPALAAAAADGDPGGEREPVAVGSIATH